jgi:heptosyltransferase-1
MKILLIRFSSFGDVVFTLPLAKALKSHRPGVEVAWAIEEPLAPLVDGASYVDLVLPARTRVWRHSLVSRGTRGEIAAFLRSLRAFAPDLVVDAQGLFKSAWATLLVPAARKVGFGPGTATERINCLATREWVDARRRPHAVDRSLALAEHVTGCGGWDRLPDVSHLVRLPDVSVDAWLGRRDGRPFALLQPWSSKGLKEWSRSSVLTVARTLAERGLEPVIKWGPADEARANALAAASGGLLLLAPPAGPAATARLAFHAALVVGVDSGPTHLAAATGAPTLALFGPTDPGRFGPVGLHAAALRGEAGHYNRRGESPSLPETDEILRAIDRLLA